MLLVNLVVCCSATVAHAVDPGPVFGSDYAGLDYNISMWDTPPSQNGDHYVLAARQCASYCEDDNRCCAWTYCPPAGTADPERCCLKFAVPTEQSSVPHWTGLPDRAINASTGGIAGICMPPTPPPPPPPTMFHNQPACLLNNGWHDIAGAITFHGTHHVFQGCPADGGWHHAASTDFVHWQNYGVQVVRIHETYRGMDSDDSPCSGFVTIDDDGIACAGFRQCSSDRGVSGQPFPWDVPLELRCAYDVALTNWSTVPDYLYNVSFYRALPYDPVRPWVDTDGQWYSTISTDACNSSTKSLPCAGGGQLDLWTSPALRGAAANWQHAGVMFHSNRTALTGYGDNTIESAELVTAGYFGALLGDPRAGKTRVITNNEQSSVGQGTTMYFIGQQENGGHFVDKNGGMDFSQPGETGMIDWGSFGPRNTPGLTGLAALRGGLSRGYSMARTLGSDPNQVVVEGRRVIVGWLFSGAPAWQSLARDLTLAPDATLRQAFVPELVVLRAGPATQGLHVELVVNITVVGLPSSPFGVFVLGTADGSRRVFIGIDLQQDLVYLDARTSGNADVRAGPVLGDRSNIFIHVYVDSLIVTFICNNQTALTAQVSADAGAMNIGTFGDKSETVSVEFEAFTLEL